MSMVIYILVKTISFKVGVSFLFLRHREKSFVGIIFFVSQADIDWVSSHSAYLVKGTKKSK